MKTYDYFVEITDGPDFAANAEFQLHHVALCIGANQLTHFALDGRAAFKCRLERDYND